jgi:hypothetical protein
MRDELLLGEGSAHCSSAVVVSTERARRPHGREMILEKGREECC